MFLSPCRQTHARTHFEHINSSAENQYYFKISKSTAILSMFIAFVTNLCVCVCVAFAHRLSPNSIHVSWKQRREPFGPLSAFHRTPSADIVCRFRNRARNTFAINLVYTFVAGACFRCFLKLEAIDLNNRYDFNGNGKQFLRFSVPSVCAFVDFFHANCRFG